jgi:hypothetical protein
MCSLNENLNLESVLKPKKKKNNTNKIKGKHSTALGLFRISPFRPKFLIWSI